MNGIEHLNIVVIQMHTDIQTISNAIKQKLPTYNYAFFFSFW